jgi:membrane protein implicated in regulation of membrane protease activity
VDGFLEWLSDNAWAGWLGVAIVLGIVETASLDLVFLMLAVGAAGGAAAAALGAPFVVQILVAVLGSAALLGVVRPIAQRHLTSAPALTTGTDALVGRQAIVVTPVDRFSGQVKLAGELWTARTFDEHDVIPAGSPVDVYAIEGATAIVYRANE